MSNLAHGAAHRSTSVLPEPAALQQPDWQHHPAYHRTCRVLAAAPPLVDYRDVLALRESLAVVAAGHARLLQLGDCAESLYECTAAHTLEKLAVLSRLAERLTERAGDPVVKVGRIGGQLAKPRSKPTERHGDRVLPSFRGHLVNSEVPTPAARQHDPRRMLWGYEASKKVLGWVAAYRRLTDLRQGHPEGQPPPLGPWASHEALVIDYESNLVRIDPETGDAYLASTHLPWIGVRTNDVAMKHVSLLASVRNPVGCKIGPDSDRSSLLRLCDALDPGREPGRLVLITRLGRERVVDALPPLVEAVRGAGHPVVWLIDPMHGNTVQTRSGLKTRHLDDVTYEAVNARRAVEDLGGHAAGLHLEVAADPVTECVDGTSVTEDDVPRAYTSLCDPRLNLEQAGLLIDAWTQA